MDEDELKDKLDWLEETGKKKAYSEKYMLKLKNIEDKNKQILLKQSAEIAQRRAEESKKFNDELQKTLEKTEKVGNFTFNKVDKKDLMNYISKPSVKIGKNKFITQFQADLGNIFKAEGDNKANFLLLAKLIKSNFDVKDLIESSKTELIKQTKSNLQKAKAGVKASSTGGGRKSLTDYFHH